MQYNTYLYIYSINKLQFIGHLKLCIFIGRKKERKKIIQSTNRALFNLTIILPLSNLTYAFGEKDNESPTWSRSPVGWYIYIYIKYVLGCKFVSQAIVSNHLKKIISNTNQYTLSCQSFRNYSNIFEIER